MLLRTNKKFLLYLIFFLFLGTLNNKNIQHFEIPKISNIEVSGLDAMNNTLIEKNLEFFKLKNLFFLKKFEIEKIINSNNLVENFSIFKKYPSSLQISIEKTKLLAYVNKNGSYYFLGSNGKLIETANKKISLPFIFGNFRNKEFFNFKSKIDKSSLNYKDIKNLYYFSSGRWDIETKNGIIIKFPQEKIIDAIDLSLKIIQSQNFQNIKIIDLRQNNQVVINE